MGLDPHLGISGHLELRTGNVLIPALNSWAAFSSAFLGTWAPADERRRVINASSLCDKPLWSQSTMSTSSPSHGSRGTTSIPYLGTSTTSTSCTSSPGVQGAESGAAGGREDGLRSLLQHKVPFYGRRTNRHNRPQGILPDRRLYRDPAQAVQGSPFDASVHPAQSQSPRMAPILDPAGTSLTGTESISQLVGLMRLLRVRGP